LFLFNQKRGKIKAGEENSRKTGQCQTKPKILTREGQDRLPVGSGSLGLFIFKEISL